MIIYFHNLQVFGCGRGKIYRYSGYTFSGGSGISLRKCLKSRCCVIDFSIASDATEYSQNTRLIEQKLHFGIYGLLKQRIEIRERMGRKLWENDAGKSTVNCSSY